MTIPMDAGAAELLHALHAAGHAAYVVGGCVRDSLLGLTPHDWDLCTSALPQQVMELFGAQRCIPTGLQHGTVTVKQSGALYEITTFRTEGTYTDGRHPDEVHFVPDVREDLARRDLTINAMAYSPQSGLVDLFHGREDLQNGVIRCVGNATARLEEDALRVLRALRLSATLGFSIAPETAAAIHRHAGGLAQWKSQGHQKKVEIPVEKPVLYQKCGNCNQTAYLRAKERYDTQREKLAGRYKAKTAMYEALMFLLIWYSVSTTLFQIILSKIFISDCVVFFDTIATFIQSIAGWIILTGKNVAQISNGISNPVITGIIYWLIRLLICGGCLVGAEILLAFTGIKIAGLYKKYCWDMITILVTLISMAIAIYFGDWIKTVLPINLLFFLLFVQLVYVGIRWYVKGWRETRGYY